MAVGWTMPARPNAFGLQPGPAAGKVRAESSREVKITGLRGRTVIGRSQMESVLRFVSERWSSMCGDPSNKAMSTLPDKFWMNSVGGRAGEGYWITALMYTEDKAQAEAFKEVLLKWQSAGVSRSSSDLIQIKK